MKKILLAVTILMSLSHADSAKGQKIFMKKIKKSCHMTGTQFVAKHSQEEWEAIGVKGMKEEIKKQCKDINPKSLKDKYMKDLYDFSYEFANDSGNVPSC